MCLATTACTLSSHKCSDVWTAGSSRMTNAAAAMHVSRPVVDIVLRVATSRHSALTTIAPTLQASYGSDIEGRVHVTSYRIVRMPGGARKVLIANRGEIAVRII